MTPTELVFNRVVVSGDEGPRELSADEFLALPLAERVAHVLNRTAEFFANDVAVDRQVALGSLRALEG